MPSRAVATKISFSNNEKSIKHFGHPHDNSRIYHCFRIAWSMMLNFLACRNVVHSKTFNLGQAITEWNNSHASRCCGDHDRKTKTVLASKDFVRCFGIKLITRPSKPSLVLPYLYLCKQRLMKLFSLPNGLFYIHQYSNKSTITR